MKKIFTLIVMMMVLAVSAKAQYVGGKNYCDGITTVEIVDHFGNVIGYRKVNGNWSNLQTGLPLGVAMGKLDYQRRREAALRTARETGGYIGYYGYGYDSGYYGTYYPVVRIGSKTRRAETRSGNDDMYGYRGSRSANRTTRTSTSASTNNNNSGTRSAAAIY